VREPAHAHTYGETLAQIPGVAIVVLVISTWTSNTCNLYSATLTLATLFRRVSTVHLGVWGALVALVAAVGGIADYFIPLLIGLGIVSAPLAGVYVVDFFVLRERVYDPRTLSELPAIRVTAFVAWLLGSAVGLVETYAGHALTGVPAVDSILIAALGQVLMNSARLRLRLRPRHPPVERS
jgi:cytosine permease